MLPERIAWEYWNIGKTALTKTETRVKIADVEKKEEYLLSP
jgi:hypothetical protein